MGYLTVKLPDHKDYKKYECAQRRQVIMKFILERGHWRNFPYTEFSKKFDISQNMVKKDIDAIKKEIAKDFPSDAEAFMHTVFNKSITDLMKGSNKDKAEAARLSKMWTEFLFDAGLKDKAAEKHEISGGPVTINIVEMKKDKKE